MTHPVLSANNVAVVTGGASGIGLAAAMRFAGIGMKVCVADLGTDGEIQLTTAFRPGVRLSVPGKKSRVSLPLEFCVKDNGPGVPDDLLANLFDPFVTTKPTGSGLGLALVAKIVGDHGGIIECESQPRKTIFRVLLPMYNASKNQTHSNSDERPGTPSHASQAADEDQ